MILYTVRILKGLHLHVKVARNWATGQEAMQKFVTWVEKVNSSPLSKQHTKPLPRADEWCEFTVPCGWDSKTEKFPIKLIQNGKTPGASGFACAKLFC